MYREIFTSVNSRIYKCMSLAKSKFAKKTYEQCVHTLCIYMYIHFHFTNTQYQKIVKFSQRENFPVYGIYM